MLKGRGLACRSGGWDTRLRSRISCGIRLIVLPTVAVLSAGISRPASALSQTPIGPLSASEQNPLYRFFLVPDAEGADPVGEGVLEIGVSTLYSSVFEVSERARYSNLFDLEQMTNSLTLRYGVLPSLEVGAKVGLYTGWDGFLDSFVSGFHEFFGFPNAGREHRPENEYLFFLDHLDLGGGPIDLGSGRVLSLETVALQSKWRVYQASDTTRVVSLTGLVRRAGGPLDEGRVEGAIGVHSRLSTESLFHLHGSLALALVDPPRQLESVARNHALYFMTAAEYRFRPGLSFIGQVRGSSNYFKGFEGGELDKIPLNLILGIGGGGGTWSWEVSFAEDLIPSGPAIDFTVGLSLARRFGLPN